MACIALMEQTTQPGYVKLLKKPIPPGVENLQRWIEGAWDLGTALELGVIRRLMFAKATTLRERISFGGDYWGHENGLALQVCRTYGLQTAHVRPFANRTLCCIHFPRCPVGPFSRGLITVPHHSPDVA